MCTSRRRIVATSVVSTLSCQRQSRPPNLRRPSLFPVAGNGEDRRVSASTSAASQPASVRSRKSPKACTWLAAVRISASSASVSTSRPTRTSSRVKPFGGGCRLSVAGCRQEQERLTPVLLPTTDDRQPTTRDGSARMCSHRRKRDRAVGLTVEPVTLGDVAQPQIQPEWSQFARGKAQQLWLVGKLRCDLHAVTVAAKGGTAASQPFARAQLASGEGFPVVALQMAETVA